MRICSKCFKPIIDEGFVVHDGEDYYCSEECLFEVHSPWEWSDMCNDIEENCYWTTWETIELETQTGEIEIEIIDVKNALNYLGWKSIEEFVVDYTHDDISHIQRIIKELKQGA